MNDLERTAMFLVNNEGSDVKLVPIKDDPAKRNYTKVVVDQTLTYSPEKEEFVVSHAEAQVYSKHGEVEQPISEKFTDDNIERLMENVSRWISKHLLGGQLQPTKS